MFSLFEEQIRRESAAYDHYLGHGAQSFAESLSYFPEFSDVTFGPDHYLNLLRRAVQAVDIPVLASLNCISSEGWQEYARMMQEAGASGIEINLYAIEANPDVSGQEVEQRYLDSLKQVKESVSIPVAMKLSPFFSAFGHMAKQMDAAGADALVLFNRFYQPDFDVDQLEVAPTLRLSHPGEIRLPLLWIALLHGKLRASLCATTGVESGEEVVKYLLAGANAVMTASSLLRYGPAYAKQLVDELSLWMEQHGFESVEQMKGGMSHARVADPTAFERANYIKILESYKF
jgi:dihydroorotate dehydrogenase (fumarate)